MNAVICKRLIYGALALLLVGVSFTVGLLIDFEFGDTAEIDRTANVEKVQELEQELEQASAISAHALKDIPWFAFSVGERIGSTAMAIKSQSAPNINSALTSSKVIEAWDELKSGLCANLIRELKDKAIEFFGARLKEHPTLSLYKILFNELIARGQRTLDNVELDCDITTPLSLFTNSYE